MTVTLSEVEGSATDLGLLYCCKRFAGWFFDHVTMEERIVLLISQHEFCHECKKKIDIFLFIFLC